MSKKENALKAIAAAGGKYTGDVMRGPNGSRQCFAFDLNGNSFVLDGSGKGATIQGFAKSIEGMTAKPLAATIELKIDLDSPEVQAALRRSAEEMAVQVTSIDHGSLVIQAIDKARADVVGPTHAFDHMIAAVERRVGRMGHAVAREATQLYRWRFNSVRAHYQDVARRLRLAGCLGTAMIELEMGRKVTWRYLQK